MKQELTELLEPVVEALGYELVLVEYQDRQRMLRLYIDRPSGVDVDDCGKISHQVSGVLDVEDPIVHEYTLEVSSPGLNRPLTKAPHFTRFIGERAKIELAIPLNGRRRFTGLLLGMRGDDVAIDVDGQEFEVPLAAIEKARLSPVLGE